MEFNQPFVMPRFQTRYGTGVGGSFLDGSDRSWGEKLTVANYRGYDPKDDYFQTGIINTESVSFSTGTEKIKLMHRLLPSIQKVLLLTISTVVIISAYAIPLLS